MFQAESVATWSELSQSQHGHSSVSHDMVIAPSVTAFFVTKWSPLIQSRHGHSSVSPDMVSAQ
eukprot:12908674-Prorocentrum_lima.AAC.1